MKILISPAKSLNLSRVIPNAVQSTQCQTIKESGSIQEVLLDKSVNDLQQMMNISPKLSQLNWERNQVLTTILNDDNARPAIFTFDGDVYDGLDIETLNSKQYTVLQERLRILSGLYGILKPFDLMQPYRLEMGTKITIGEAHNLYEFWKEKLTAILQDELKEENDATVVNLASVEYSKSINLKTLKATVIAPQFKDFKNGAYKVISFYAKKARGMMARHLINAASQTLDDLLLFDSAGYSYSEEHTKDEHQPVFIR